LYGCETWSLKRGRSQAEGLEKRVLRKIVGPKRDEVTGVWIKLHREKLHGLYCSVSAFINLVIQKYGDEIGRACGTYDGEEYVQGFGEETS
jgi:hypothetical protein